jgi:hypothetical protein
MMVGILNKLGSLFVVVVVIYGSMLGLDDSQKISKNQIKMIKHRVFNYFKI